LAVAGVKWGVQIGRGSEVGMA